MSDVSTDPGSSPAPATDGPPPEQGSPAGEGPDILAEPPSGINTFDRAYVEKVRGEAAKWRTQAREALDAHKTYEVFDAYEPDDRDVWVTLARTWQNDPNAAAEMMQHIASGVLGEPATDEESDAEAVPEVGDMVGDRPMTRQEVAELIETRELQRAEQARLDAEVATVIKTVADAGYAEGTPEHQSILWRASTQTQGDLDAAIAAHKAYEQSIVDRYVASKTGAVTSPNGGTAGTGRPELTTLRDATRAAEEYFRSRNGAGA